MRFVLRLLSLGYELAVNLRNWGYDAGFLRETNSPFPTICVGNLQAGGTGKTPLCEHVLEEFLKHGKAAYLSRGYGRISSGFIELDATSEAHLVGDESAQVKSKFPLAVVAVCENRVQGAGILKRIHPDLSVLIMDDGFQHRSIKPTVSVLTTTFHKPFWREELLPLGRLREPVSGVRRAKAVVVTKCPQQVNQLECERLVADAAISVPIFFAAEKLAHPVPLNNSAPFEKAMPVLLLSAVGDSVALEARLRNEFNLVYHLKFADHYRFTAEDIVHLENLLAARPKETVVITTEKDAQRLREHQRRIADLPIYFVPMKIQFLHNDEHRFNQFLHDIF